MLDPTRGVLDVRRLGPEDEVLPLGKELRLVADDTPGRLSTGGFGSVP